MENVLLKIREYTLNEKFRKVLCLSIHDANGNTLLSYGQVRISSSDVCLLATYSTKMRRATFHVNIHDSPFLCFVNSRGEVLGRGNFNTEQNTSATDEYAADDKEVKTKLPYEKLGTACPISNSVNINKINLSKLLSTKELSELLIKPGDASPEVEKNVTCKDLARDSMGRNGLRFVSASNLEKQKPKTLGIQERNGKPWNEKGVILCANSESGYTVLVLGIENNEVSMLKIMKEIKGFVTENPELSESIEQ